MTWCWLALVSERPRGAAASASAGEDMWLAVWDPGRQPPVPGAARADARIVDAHGAAAVVSYVRAPPGVRLPFDDLAVQQARRLVLGNARPALVTTLLSHSSHFEGSLTAWRGGGIHEDPFARIFPALRLQIGAGVLGSAPPPAGPVIERYGSSSPWPQDRFSTSR